MPKHAASRGVQIRYDELGRGEPVLLCLSGWCDDGSVFAALGSRASAHRRVLIVDWPGHGGSATPPADFGERELVECALSVIEASGARRVVPVAMAHAGWVAIEVRRRLGERVPRLVLLSWIVGSPPPPFLAALDALQVPDRWAQTREQLFALWLTSVDNPHIVNHVRQGMASHGFEMWARAAREIHRAYARHGNPLQALSALVPPVPTLHLYSQPSNPEYLAMQQAFAAAHPWFHVRRLDGRSHFPPLELPDATAEAIEEFAGG